MDEQGAKDAARLLSATPAGDALALVDRALDALSAVDLDSLPPAQQLALLEELEARRRRLDHVTDCATGAVDASGAYGIDGHRTPKAAVKARCRVSGPEAHGRVRSQRVLRQMPAVAAAQASGTVPTENIRAIARTMSNPRVADLASLVDDVFAEQAAAQTPEEFRAWLRDWERLADADGAEQEAEANHERRNFSLLESSVDSSWTLRGAFGGLQGAAIAEIFRRFEDAEFEKDWRAAKAIHGDDTRVEHLARTPAQRRADALFEVFRRAAAAPADARSPEPLVNVVVDAETFREALTRAGGAPVDRPDVRAVGGRRCQTVGGTRLSPSEALAAALHGHVRRVVVDGASTVIDLGRRRRLFTGSARDAALLQIVLRSRARLSCGWIGCDAPSHRIQADHEIEWNDRGRTSVTNVRGFCGPHNRLKHHLVKSGQDPGGLWRVRRPE